MTIESLSDLQQGYDLNYIASLGGGGTAAITTTGVLTGNGRVTKAVTIIGNGVINLSSPPTLPSGGSTLTSTLTATGGNWNGVGTVTGVTRVSSNTFTIGSGANLVANGNVSVEGTGAIGRTGTITGSVTYISGATDVFPGIIAGTGGKAARPSVRRSVACSRLHGREYLYRHNDNYGRHATVRKWRDDGFDRQHDGYRQQRHVGL